MAEISRFFGIVIGMFAEVGERHHLPHFHARYQDAMGVYSIDEIELIKGQLPRPQHRLVLAWAELHRRELRANWEALGVGEPAAKIEPLR